MLANRKISILLIEDEDYDVRRIRNTIKPFESKIKIRDVVSNGQAALELLEKNSKKYDVIIMDFQIVGGLTGENLIRKMKSIDPTLQIIVVTKMTTNISDFEFANKLLEAGAMWYCTKYPGDIEEYIYQPTDFILSIFNASEKRCLEIERLRSAQKLDQNVQTLLEEKRIVGESETIQILRKQIDKAAQTEASVLIHGGSGTGKELVAANIHYQSVRKFEKFIPINCGSLPHELIESELFGFEKGSFTGAHNKKSGLLEVAHKGTAFLDEIAELPASAQVKLLRFLQEGEIDKIGRTDKMQVDVRIIAATNKNIEEEVKAGNFREDLYYRLNVFPIRVPPLNEHPEDIVPLIQHYLKKYSREMGKESPLVDQSVLELLQNYDWPGNVRELQNVVQRLLLIGGNKIKREDISAAMENLIPFSEKSGDGKPKWNPEQILSLREMEQKIRGQYFQFVRENSLSDADAARKLGLAPPNYYRMCKELGLK